MENKIIRFETFDGWLCIYPSFVKRMERFLKITEGNCDFSKFFKCITRDYSNVSYITKNEQSSIQYTAEIADIIKEYSNYFALKQYPYFYMVYNNELKIRIDK